MEAPSTLNLNLLRLRNVRDDGPAVKHIGGNRYAVEPGDATRYTVHVADDVAVGYVGTDVNDYGGVVAVLGTERAEPFGRAFREKYSTAEYSRAVLTYYCLVALGVPMKEPPELAYRRCAATAEASDRDAHERACLNRVAPLGDE